MLSSMRKSAGSWMIKILLGLIVVAFIFTGAGSFYSRQEATVAKVNGEPITIDEYQRTYYNIMQNLEQRFGNQLNQDLLDMLNVKNQALNQVIEKHLLLQVAAENGLRVPDAALARAITEIPAFQDNGHFDSRRYRQLLEQNRMSPEGFESMQKESMLTGMIRNLVASAVPVSVAEARAWYNWQNTAVKIDYAVFSGKDFSDINAAEEEIAAYFDAHKEQYKSDPMVKARYLRFDPADFRDEVRVADGEIKDYYEAHSAEFRTPEKVTARHILFKVAENADDDTVAQIRGKALEITEKARDGENFAELAEKYSEGPTAKDGGYLGSFEREDMVEPFSEKAFSMEAGEISEPVRTRFGWHVIKVEEHQPAAVKTLEEVREEIREKLTAQQTRTIAYDKAWSLYEISFEGDDMIKNARDLDLSLETTDFFTKAKGPGELEDARDFAETAFGIPLTEISDGKEIGDAYFLIQPIEQKEARIPALEDVREKVEADVVRQKQKEAAQKAAEAFLKQIESAQSFDAAAQTAGIEAETTEFFKRNQAIPGIGNNRQLTSAAFSLSPENPVPETVVEDGDRFYVIHLNEQKVPADDDFEAEQQTAMAQLKEEKNRQAVNQWVAALRQNSEIRTSDRFSD